MAYSYDFNDLIPTKYRDVGLDPAAVTSDVEYQDGGKNFGENSETFPRRWEFIYEGLTPAEASEIDTKFNEFRFANSFPFTDKAGAVHTDCHFESYERDHERHKQWKQRRSFVIVKFDAEIPDLSAPTVPTGLAISNETSAGFTADWNASTDNVGVAGYKLTLSGGVYSGYEVDAGDVLTKVVSTSLVAGITYSVQVAAYDAAGNASAWSAAVQFSVAFDYSSIATVWHEIKEETGYVLNDDVNPLTDHSGNSNDASNAVASERPHYITNVLNSHPVIRLDSGANYSYTSFNEALGTSFSWLFLLKIDVSSRYGIIRDNAGTVAFRVTNSTNLQIYKDAATYDAAIDNCASNFVAIEITCDGVDTFVRSNNVLKATHPGLTFNGKILEWLFVDIGGFYFKGDFVLGLFKPSPFTSTDRTNVYAQILSDYGI